MTSCMRRVSVQYFSSPNVSQRKMSRPIATADESSCSTGGAVESLPSHDATPTPTRNAPTTSAIPVHPISLRIETPVRSGCLTRQPNADYQICQAIIVHNGQSGPDDHIIPHAESVVSP